MPASLEDQKKVYQSMISTKRIITPEEFNNLDGLSIRVFLEMTWNEVNDVIANKEKLNQLNLDDQNYLYDFSEVLAQSVLDYFDSWKTSIKYTLDHSIDEMVNIICKTQTILNKIK